MNGRVYDATLARFTSADPHIQAPYNSQSFNRYSYVWNNPMKYSDPSGFYTWSSTTGESGSTGGCSCGLTTQSNHGGSVHTPHGGGSAPPPMPNSLPGAINPSLVDDFNPGGDKGGFWDSLFGKALNWLGDCGGACFHPNPSQLSDKQLEKYLDRKLAGGWITYEQYEQQLLAIGITPAYLVMAANDDLDDLLGVDDDDFVTLNPLGRPGTGGLGPDGEFKPYVVGAGAPIAGRAVSPNAHQAANVKRFQKKIPSNSKDSVELRQLPNNGLSVQATSYGKVPGSKAVYEKQIDVNGKTLQATKTTYDPQGNIVHVKDKLNGGTFP